MWQIMGTAGGLLSLHHLPQHVSCAPGCAHSHPAMWREGTAAGRRQDIMTGAAITASRQAMDSQQRGAPSTARCGTMWRPWHEPAVTVQQQSSVIQGPINGSIKLPDFQHPVKLFWPKSKCYDFLYQEAEELLKNFPVQATISFYQESDSSASEDEETYEN